MQVSVIICTYNREQYIQQSILKLLDQSVNADTYEVVVINNNSTDSTDTICSELLRTHPNAFRYYIEYNQGLSYARNRGIKEAKGDILVFIDDDAMAAHEFIEHLLKFYLEHPKVHATGGRIYPLYETAPPTWLSKYLKPLLSVIDLGDKALNFKGKSYPIGANMAFRRTAIDAAGDFNTALGRTGKNMLGGEEKDIFFRIRKSGMQIWYVPDVIVHHVVPVSRLQIEFIRRQGNGIGKSEYIRTKEEGTIRLYNAYLRECIKWIATGILCLGYLFALQPSRGWMLIRFRYWVSMGLFNHSLTI